MGHWWFHGTHADWTIYSVAHSAQPCIRCVCLSVNLSVLRTNFWQPIVVHEHNEEEGNENKSKKAPKNRNKGIHGNKGVNRKKGSIRDYFYVRTATPVNPQIRHEMKFSSCVHRFLPSITPVEKENFWASFEKLMDGCAGRKDTYRSPNRSMRKIQTHSNKYSASSGYYAHRYSQREHRIWTTTKQCFSQPSRSSKRNDEYTHNTRDVRFSSIQNPTIDEKKIHVINKTWTWCISRSKIKHWKVAIAPFLIV